MWVSRREASSRLGGRGSQWTVALGKDITNVAGVSFLSLTTLRADLHVGKWK